MKKHNRFGYLILITTLCLYEIVAFLAMYTHRFCDLWLFPCGLQYIILCLIVPVITVLLWVWVLALFTKARKWVKNISHIIILCIPFILLGLYLILRPIIYDFTNREYSKALVKPLMESCVERETSSSKQFDIYDIKNKCDSFAKFIEWDIHGKIITRQQFLNYIGNQISDYTNWPYYFSLSCSSISTRELLRCKSQEKKEGMWCSCFGNMVAFIIKKNPNIYFSNRQINAKLQQIRQEARSYCDKEQKATNFMKWRFDFCEANKI